MSHLEATNKKRTKEDNLENTYDITKPSCLLLPPLYFLFLQPVISLVNHFWQSSWLGAPMSNPVLFIV